MLHYPEVCIGQPQYPCTIHRPLEVQTLKPSKALPRKVADGHVPKVLRWRHSILHQTPFPELFNSFRTWRKRDKKRGTKTRGKRLVLHCPPSLPPPPRPGGRPPGSPERISLASCARSSALTRDWPGPPWPRCCPRRGSLLGQSISMSAKLHGLPISVGGVVEGHKLLYRTCPAKPSRYQVTGAVRRGRLGVPLSSCIQDACMKVRTARKLIR